MTLQFMDTLFQRDNLQKSQFFKGLPKIISKLPKVGTFKSYAIHLLKYTQTSLIGHLCIKATCF